MNYKYKMKEKEMKVPWEIYKEILKHKHYMSFTKPKNELAVKFHPPTKKQRIDTFIHFYNQGHRL